MLVVVVRCWFVNTVNDRSCKPLLHQYILSLSKTLNPHSISGLTCEMSTKGNILANGICSVL